MLPSLTSTVVAVKPSIDATLRWIYQKTFFAKDRIAFYDMLAFLLGIVVLMMHIVRNKFIPKLDRLIPREKWDGAQCKPDNGSVGVNTLIFKSNN